MSGGTTATSRVITLVVSVAGLPAAAATATRSLGAIERSINLVKASLLAFGLTKFIGVVKDVIDSATQMNNVLSTLNETSAQSAVTQAQLFRIAEESRSPVDNVAKLYVRLAAAVEQVGASQSEVFKVTEAVTKGLKLSGASAGETASAILQLSQAFASGRLQGDEFRAVLENAPILAKELAKQLFNAGVIGSNSLAALRAAAKKGDLDLKAVFNAFLGASNEIDVAYAKLTPTLSDFFTVLRDESIRAFTEIDRTYHVLGTLGETITFLTDHIHELIEALIYLSVVVLARYVALGIGAVLTEVATAGGAIAGLTSIVEGAVLAFGGWPVVIFAAVAALAVFAASQKDALGRFQDYKTQFAALSPEKLDVKIAELAAQRADLLAQQAKMVAGGTGEGVSSLEAAVTGSGAITGLADIHEKLADVNVQIGVANDTSRALKEGLTGTGDAAAQAAISIQALADAMEALTRKESSLRDELTKLQSGDLAGYQKLVDNQKAQERYETEKASLEGKLKRQLSAEEAAALRVELQSVTTLEEQVQKAHSGLLKSQTASEAAIKKAQAAIEAADKAAQKKHDKMIENLTHFHPQIEIAAETDLIREKISDVGKEDALLQDIEARRKAILAYQVQEKIVIEQHLPISAKELEDLKAQILLRERESVLLEQKTKAFDDLKSLAISQNPAIGGRDEIKKVQDQLNVPGVREALAAFDPATLEAINKALIEMKEGITGIAQAADYLKSINSPFAGLLEGLSKFHEVATAEHQTTSDQIKAIGEGSLATLGFITDQMATLGIENFEFQKQIAAVTAIINSALAVTEVLAKVPPPYSFVLAGVIAGLTAAQVAVIEAQQPPARFGGGAVSAGIPYNTGERGPEMYHDTSGRQIFIPAASGTITPGSGKGAQVTVINQGPPLAVRERRQNSNGDIELIVGLAAQASEDRFEASLRSGQGKYSRALQAHTTSKRSL